MATGDPRVAKSSQALPARPSPEVQEVLGGLERILGSGDFDGSPRSRDFLRFIVEETLAGRADGLTQPAIAVRVFGRRKDFDALVDPIVRIQAGRLRRSLERYYLLEGADDPVHIELPRGGYVPVFRWAEPAHPTEAGTGKRDPVGDRGGWPSIDLLVRAGREGEAEEAAARFRDYLAVELDRYRDVRVVGRHDPSRAQLSAGKAPTFVLTVRLLQESGHPRVSVDLEHGRTSRQVWAEEYRGDPERPEEFHRETVRIVAACVASEHGVVAQTLCGQNLPPETEGTTYGALLHSYRFFLAREPAHFVPALEALRRAVGRDPECALAWVQLSRLHVANHAFEVATADTSLEQGLAFAQHAVHLDPSSQRARTVLAFAHLVEGETASGLAEAEAALALSPESFVYAENIGWLLWLLGDWERGTVLVRKAIARNPHYMALADFAICADHLRRGEFGDAYQTALRWREPAFFWRSLMRACCLGHLGRPEDARGPIADILRTKPDFKSRGRTLISRILKHPEMQARVTDGLAKAELVLDR